MPGIATVRAVTDMETVTAEYTDLMRASRPGTDLLAELARVLPDLGIAGDSAVVDLGAGTGLGTVAVAEALPGARVHAVECSPAMRSQLMSRLAARPDLWPRVTVHPEDVFGARLPERWAAAVAVHLVCQLDPAERRELWRLFADRLARGAPAVIDRCFGATKSERRAERLVASATLGEHEYQRWFFSEPEGGGRVRNRVTYRTVRLGEVVAERVTESVLWVVHPDDVFAEMEAAGLRCTPQGHFLVLQDR